MTANLSTFSIPHLPNVSLVAFYQNKPSQLSNLIQKLIDYLTAEPIIKSKFTNYQIEQIHGTVIGCEGLCTNLGIINKWFYELRQEIRYCDLAGWIYYLQQINFPIIIRFGGYQTKVDYQFLSRQQHPAIRTFQLQQTGEQTLIPVLIGWSFDNQKITLELEQIRRHAQEFNLLHKYHSTTNSIDNDFYLRLGTIVGEFNPQQISWLEQEIRNFLQAQVPVDIYLDRNDLAFVRYEDLNLSLSTTEMLPLTQATATKLQQFYEKLSLAQ